MTVLTRRLPQTLLSRHAALNAAFTKFNNLPLGTVVLNPATATRLTTGVPILNQNMLDLATAQANLSANTPVKNEAVEDTRLFVSHFIQVFNLGVRRGKYPAAHRAFYQLDVGSDALPSLGTEAEVTSWAQYLITGDGARITAGGVAMANPDITEVVTAKTASDTALATQSDLYDILDGEQEDMEENTPEADTLIKRIWDEVEAYHGEESPESKRESARQWGVVYITKGPGAQLSGLIKDAAGNPLAAAELEVVQTGSKAIANIEGRYVVSTTVIGPVTLRASYPGKPNADLEITIPDHEDEIELNVPDILMS